MLTGRQLFIFLKIVLIPLCVFVIYFFYTNDIHPDQIARNSFIQGDCQVVDKKLSMVNDFAQRYRADFLINYSVNGVSYQRWVSGNGLDRSYQLSRAKQERLLSQYQSGNDYTCWYDGAEPQNAVLVLRYDWLDFLLLLIAGFVGLMSAFSLVNTRPATA